VELVVGKDHASDGSGASIQISVMRAQRWRETEGGYAASERVP